MQYFGGKSRIATDIVDVIKADGHTQAVDMFCGGLSVSVAMAKAGFTKIVAADGNLALIMMYKAYREGWRPPATLSEAEYRELQGKQDPSDPMTAFAGFACSFAAKWFGGYARNTRGDDYVKQATNGLAKKFAILDRVPNLEFNCLRFEDLDPGPSGLAVYADPPYDGTTAYGGMFPWDASQFWATANTWAVTNPVYVSEYVAPFEWREVWSKDHYVNTRGRDTTRIERLFYKGPQ